MHGLLLGNVVCMFVCFRIAGSGSTFVNITARVPVFLIATVADIIIANIIITILCCGAHAKAKQLEA